MSGEKDDNICHTRALHKLIHSKGMQSDRTFKALKFYRVQKGMVLVEQLTKEGVLKGIFCLVLEKLFL